MSFRRHFAKEKYFNTVPLFMTLPDIFSIIFKQIFFRLPSICLFLLVELPVSNHLSLRIYKRMTFSASFFRSKQCATNACLALKVVSGLAQTLTAEIKSKAEKQKNVFRCLLHKERFFRE